MPTPCLVDPTPTSLPWLFNVKPGIIKLILNAEGDGTFLFEPDSKVVTTSGQPVSAQCTTMSFSFSAEEGKSYSVHIILVANSADAQGSIIEGCDNPRPLALISGITHWTNLVFHVAGGGQ